MESKAIFKKIFNNETKNILIIIFLMFVLFLLLHDACDSSIIGASNWNSYEIQADSWLKGRLDIDNRTYLELAIFQEKYYVSFPPFPSVVMLPFIAILGLGNVPNNLIMFVVATMTVILAYRILRKFETSEVNSILISLSMVAGSSILALSLNGGVWFVAQLFNLFLCTLAVKYLLEGKKARTYFCLALAVGCRPFSAVYLIASFLYFLIKDREFGFVKAVCKNLLPLLPMIIVALIYMGYNYARFGNPLEFGHNYLPEFTSGGEGNYGQFSLNYLWPNLKETFLPRIIFDERLNIRFSMPFMFLIANPLTLVWIIDGIKKLIKCKKINLYRLIFFLAIVANILLICLHKTLGGWQFGARYLCDLLPFCLLGLLLQNTRPEFETEEVKGIISADESISGAKLDRFQIACIIFGFMLNIVGSFEFWRDLM